MPLAPLVDMLEQQLRDKAAVNARVLDRMDTGCPHPLPLFRRHNRHDVQPPQTRASPLPVLAAESAWPLAPTPGDGGTGGEIGGNLAVADGSVRTAIPPRRHAGSAGCAISQFCSAAFLPGRSGPGPPGSPEWSAPDSKDGTAW